MATFEEVVISMKNSFFIGSYVDCIYGTSKAGQRFAILITWGLLGYALRVIMDDDYRQYKVCTDSLDDYLVRETRVKKDGIYEAAQEYQKRLEHGLFMEIYKSLPLGRTYSEVRVMPSDCASNPDIYLHKGDLIQSTTNHEGIYIGNGHVVHVPGQRSGNAGFVALIGKLFGDFVDKPDAPVRVVVYHLRFLTGHEIAKRAIDWVNRRYESGKCDVLNEYPNHFARLCTLSYEQGDNVQEVIDFMRSMKMDILPVTN